jgi:hypothetical protein
VSDEAPAAKKLTIEIEDIGDRRECIAAVRKLVEAIKKHYGSEEASSLLLDATPPPDERERGRFRERARLYMACKSFDDNALRLILEYYAMPKPNKEKLARDLAKKNESLPEWKRYPVKSKEDPAAAILQQIKRAFRFDNEACRIIGEVPEHWRQERLKDIEERRLLLLKITRKIKLPRIRYKTIRRRFNRPEDDWIFNGGQKRA